MSLFVLSSRDGWVNIMYTGLDAVGVDQQVTVTEAFVLQFYFIPRRGSRGSPEVSQRHPHITRNVIYAM
jgi:hypothetical protein